MTGSGATSTKSVARLTVPLPINVAIYAIDWMARIRRILAEEVLLSLDPAYRDYMANVRWRLIPGLV